MTSVGAGRLVLGINLKRFTISFLTFSDIITLAKVHSKNKTRHETMIVTEVDSLSDTPILSKMALLLLLLLLVGGGGRASLAWRKGGRRGLESDVDVLFEERG